MCRWPVLSTHMLHNFSFHVVKKCSREKQVLGRESGGGKKARSQRKRKQEEIRKERHKASAHEEVASLTKQLGQTLQI